MRDNNFINEFFRSDILEGFGYWIWEFFKAIMILGLIVAPIMILKEHGETIGFYIFGAVILAIPIAVIVGAFLIMRNIDSIIGKIIVLVLAILLDVYLVKLFFRGPKPRENKGKEKTEQVEATEKATKSKKTTFVLQEQPGMLEELGLTFQDTLTA